MPAETSTAVQTLPTSAAKTISAAVPPPSIQKQEIRWPSPFELAALVVAAIAFLPILEMHRVQLWERPHYQFFVFVLIGAPILAWTRWKDVETIVPGDPSLALGGFILSWALLAFAEIAMSPSIGMIAALTFIAACVYRLGGWALTKAMAPAWFFLWTIIPFPFGLDQALVNGMQSLTSSWSSFFLDYFGVYHNLSGNVVNIAGEQLLVEEACAGVNSLFAILACTLFLILLQRRSWIRGGILIAASIFWVLVTNVIRVTTIAIASDRYQVNLSEGPRHELLGVACFLLAVLLVWSTDRLLLFFKPDWVDDLTPTTRPKQQTAVGSSPIRLSFCPPPVALAFAIPLAAHILIYGIFAPAKSTRDNSERIAAINESTLPHNLVGWKKVRYWTKDRAPGSDFGEHSKHWAYEFGKLHAVVSFDYPFPDYHELLSCYTATGWIQPIRRTKEYPDAVPENVVEVSMRKPGMYRGYLLYSEYNADGDSLEYQSRLAKTLASFDRATTVLGDWVNGRPPTKFKARGPAYQFQVFAETDHELSDDERRNVEVLHHAAVRSLHRHLFGDGAK